MKDLTSKQSKGYVPAAWAHTYLSRGIRALLAGRLEEADMWFKDAQKRIEWAIEDIAHQLEVAGGNEQWV